MKRMIKSAMSHSGTVLEIKDESLTVKLLLEGECGACVLSAACGVQAATLSVAVGDVSVFSLGDRVVVTALGATRIAAVMLYLMIPVILFVVAGFVLQSAGYGSVAVAAGMIGSVGIWYGAVYAVSRRTGRIPEWVVEKCEE